MCLLQWSPVGLFCFHNVTYNCGGRWFMNIGGISLSGYHTVLTYWVTTIHTRQSSCCLKVYWMNLQSIIYLAARHSQFKYMLYFRSCVGPSIMRKKHIVYTIQNAHPFNRAWASFTPYLKTHEMSSLSIHWLLGIPYSRITWTTKTPAYILYMILYFLSCMGLSIMRKKENLSLLLTPLLASKTHHARHFRYLAFASQAETLMSITRDAAHHKIIKTL